MRNGSLGEIRKIKQCHNSPECQSARPLKKETKQSRNYNSTAVSEVPTEQQQARGIQQRHQCQQEKYRNWSSLPHQPGSIMHYLSYRRTIEHAP